MSWLQRFWNRTAPRDKTFAYVRLHCAEDHLKCGWIPHDTLQNTPHGEYSVFMEYINCGCKRMPRPGHAKGGGAIPTGSERG